jgi:hypothetical protein
MKISEELRKKIGGGLLRLVKECEPNFGTLGQETKLVGCENVGVSFEPRLKLRYEISFEGKTPEIYEQTLVFSGNFQQVTAIVGAHWV